MVHHGSTDSLRDVVIQMGYKLWPIKNGGKRPDAPPGYKKTTYQASDLKNYRRVGLEQGGEHKLWTLDVDVKNHHDPQSLREEARALVYDHFNEGEFIEKNTASAQKGLHFIFKSSELLGTSKFAHTNKGVILEGMGEGYYIVIYEEDQSRVLAELAGLKEVDSERIKSLMDDCILRDEKPREYNYEVNHFELFNNQVSWDQILSPLGYTHVKEDSKFHYWKRPGTKQPFSGKVSKESDRYFNWSTSVGELPHASSRKSLDKAFVYCALNHLDVERIPIRKMVEDFYLIIPEKKPTKLKAKDFLKDGSLPPFIKTLGEYVEIGKELPPIKGYFDRWISSNAVTMFFAPTGVGKSIAMMYISELVTKGLSFEPELPNENEPKNVFYIDMELREEDIYDRYPNYLNNKRFFRFQKPVQGEPHYDQYWDMSGHDQLEFLLESSESIENLGLIVVDNLSFFFPDEGDVKVGKKLMGLLSNHAKSRGCAIVVINHKTKANSQTGRLTADQMRGTGRLLDLSDYVFMLNRLENDLMYFQFNKGRNYKGFRSLDEVLQIEKTEINGMLGFKPVQWIKEADLLASVQAEKTPEQLHKEQQLLELGAEMHRHHVGGKSYRDIAKLYHYSHTHVSRMIDKYLATVPIEVLKERGKNIPVEESKIEL